MPRLTRITRDPAVMGGKPCIRGMRVTVGTVVGLVAAGHTRDETLRDPFLEAGASVRPCTTPRGEHRKSKFAWGAICNGLARRTDVAAVVTGAQCLKSLTTSRTSR
jgi:hypothetical protein